MAEANAPGAAVQGWLKLPITALAAVAALVAIVYLYYSGISTAVGIPAAILALMACGMVISSVNGFDGFYGLYMLKSGHGLQFIDWLAKRIPYLWRALPEWGGIVGFGLLSRTIVGRKASTPTVALGIASIAAIILLIVPNSVLLLKFLNIPGLSSLGGGTVSLQVPVLSLETIVLLAIGIFGGMLFFMLAVLAFGSFTILYSIFVTLSTVVAGKPNYSALAGQLPGVVPTIPGLTIPLVSGILSLALVLVVHEFSHGILSRLSKVRLKSIGIMPFGIIPIGAFVEPDEKQVAKLGKGTQNGIFMAGVSSNFLMALLFFVLTALMILYVMPSISRPGVVVAYVFPGTPAYNTIKPGSVVYSWNGHRVYNLSSVEAAARTSQPLSIVNINTSTGDYSLRSNATGKVGVGLQFAQVPYSRGPWNVFVNSVYSFLVLSFVLNFFIGGFNLLPLPGLDGWRIYKNRIKNKKTLHAMGWILGIVILLLLLPWVWLLL